MSIADCPAITGAGTGRSLGSTGRPLWEWTVADGSNTSTESAPAAAAARSAGTYDMNVFNMIFLSYR
jgi:hypothetical protein